MPAGREPGFHTPGDGPGRLTVAVLLRRTAAAVLAAVVTAGGIGLVLGLLGGGPLVGAADNADGRRLFCTAGLLPDDPALDPTWRGVVITTFTTGHATCGPPTSSAAAILRAATTGAGPLWSLTTLAWVYVALTALGVALAAAALPGRRALLVGLPLLPLVAVPWWSRFDASTYAEPAGLLGAVWLLLGLLIVAGTAPAARGARLAALALVVAGGVVAATAKPGFVPVGVVAALAAVTVAVGDRRRWWARAPGLVAGLLTVGLAAGPVVDAVATQDRRYGAVNTHHVVFTVLLPELGPDVLPRLGFPPAAAAASGESFYWNSARGIPGWGAALGTRPVAARADARAELLGDPGLVVRVVDRALGATLRPALPYLPSVPRGSAPERNETRTIYPEVGPVGDVQRVYLAGIAGRWVPTAFVVLAVLAGLATLLPRKHRPRAPGVGLVRVAAAGAVAALGVATTAVLGDGFYELTKHVWLASYLLVTSALVLLAAVAVTVAGRRPRPPPSG